MWRTLYTVKYRIAAASELEPLPIYSRTNQVIPKEKFNNGRSRLTAATTLTVGPFAVARVAAVPNICGIYSSFTLRIDGIVILGMQCPAECRNRLVVKGLVPLEFSRSRAQPISCDLLLDIAFPKSQRHLFST